jgi:hypothetical protein
MPWRVDPKRDGRRPIKEEAVESCTGSTVKWSGEFWSDCTLPPSDGICVDRRAKRRLDQVQILLLRGLLLQGPHI